MRPADVVALAAALGGRPRPRLAVGAFAAAAAADVVLLAGGVLLTRESTRSAVSRSVSRVATAARSVSRRASRSLIFVFSALIWSNIVGVVVGIVAFTGFRSIGIDQSCWRLTPQCGIFNCRMRRLTSLAADASCGCAQNLMRHEQAHRRASETVGLLAMPVTVKLRRPGMTEVGPAAPANNGVSRQPLPDDF